MNSLYCLTEKFIDWLFRKRSPALIVFRSGVVLLTLSIAGSLVFQIKYQGQGESFAFIINTSEGTSFLIQLCSVILGALLTTIGLVWEIFRYRNDSALSNRRRVIVIEQRGLRDTSDTPLSEAIPVTILGQRDPLIIDIRERVNDGKVTQPEKALQKITLINSSLDQKCASHAKSDISIAYGGLMPVPFTFLTGFLLDDESKLIVFDWDRNSENWRLLDGTDDKERFEVSKPISSETAKEAVLAISVSYQVDLEKIYDSFPSIPLTHMKLSRLTSTNHWSNEKQAALASQFLNAVKEISASGVKKLHLIIAAPNSVVLQLGRAYDKRNLPEAVIYQYERSNTPAYPWGVLLPTHGVAEARIIFTNVPTNDITTQRELVL